MNETVTLTIDGRSVTVPSGTTIASAVLIAGNESIRRSVNGSPRGPLCGMGICYECRATIDGVAQQRTCQRLVVAGMEVVTHGGERRV